MGQGFAFRKEPRYNRSLCLDKETSDTQLFTPTPGTLSTAMYHSGLSPAGKAVAVEKDVHALQQRKQVLAAD